MKVLVLSHLAPSEAEPLKGIFVHEEVKALRAQGIDARIVSSSPHWMSAGFGAILLLIAFLFRNEKSGWGETDGVPVMRFAWPVVYSGSLKWHSPLYCLGLRRVLSQILASFDFDLIHAHTSLLDGAAGAKLAAATGRPLIITEHMGPFSTFFADTDNALTVIRAMHGANCILVPSAAQKDAVKEQLKSQEDLPLRVFAHGINVSVFRPQTLNREPDGKVHFLWVGSHDPVKRLDRLLLAFKKALEHRSDLRLTLMGPEDHGQTARGLIASLGLESSVRILPPGGREDVARQMNLADFLVVSSETETFSCVAAEALCCGTPVLSTKCGGPQDIVSGPEFGLLVENSQEGLERGILEIASDLETFTRGEIAAKAAQRFALTDTSRRLVSIYEDTRKAAVVRRSAGNPFSLVQLAWWMLRSGLFGHLASAGSRTLARRATSVLVWKTRVFISCMLWPPRMVYRAIKKRPQK